MKIIRSLLFFAFSLLLTQIVDAADWPQWMGPNRDGVWSEQGIIREVPQSGLDVKWRVPVGLGYSGPAAANGFVYVSDYVKQSGDSTNGPSRRAELSGVERLSCFRADTGELVWRHQYSRKYALSYPAGPRATPVVVENEVYMLGAEGDLLCLSADSGKLIWKRALKEEYKVQSPIWGFSAHPLVYGDLIYCIVGGNGSVAVAFNRKNGREHWKALSASEPGYCPPTIIEAAGKPQLLIWDADKLNSLEPTTGKVYWSQPLKPAYGMSIAAPRKSGNVLFASGIGNVGAAFELGTSTPSAKLLWRGDTTTGVYCANSTPLIVDGTIFGVGCQKGLLIAADLKTGKRHWETTKPTTGDRPGSHGTAFIVKNGDRYFLFNETGDLIVASLSNQGYVEHGRFHVLEPTNECFGRSVVWSHPAFANKSMYARNDKELVCVSLSEDD